MRSRSVFLEDGRRLFNIGTLAPDAIWTSVEADFDRTAKPTPLNEPLRQATRHAAGEGRS